MERKTNNLDLLRANKNLERLEASNSLWWPDEWIIDEELRREKERQDSNRPGIGLELPQPDFAVEPPSHQKEDDSSGGRVIIIDL